MSERISDVRERIVRAAAELLAAGGREAVSTRAVSAAAGVQAPTIYRQFGDMRGLLDAVAQETFVGYVRQKAAHQRTDDPLADLRRGWDLHVAFGLANPAAYALMHSDPVLTTDSPAARDAAAMLEEQLARVAEAGRLRVSVPQAARMISAAARGVVLSLIGTPAEARDARLSEAVREAVLAAVTVAPGADDAVESTLGRVAARAVALRAVLVEAPDVLSAAERQLLGEWLDRLAGAGD
jgi:AcrR family transcriptional regulator